MKGQMKGNIMLIICAFIWGSTFVAQSTGMDKVGPWTYQSVRSIIGCIVLIPVIFLFDLLKKKDGLYEKESKEEKKNLIIGGTICGLILAVASYLQNLGLSLGASSGDAGFITALYILIVPIARMFLGKRPGIKVWIGVFVALIGLYFLTGGISGITWGAVSIFGCAVIFTGHILVVDHYSPKVNGVKLSCIQFFVSAVFAGIFMLIFEKPAAFDIWNAKGSILYAGVLSSGVAYTLQILGQKYTKPTPATMIMSLESVFALLSGMLIQPEENPFEILKMTGCALIFAAIIIAQLPGKKEKQYD